MASTQANFLYEIRGMPFGPAAEFPCSIKSLRTALASTLISSSLGPTYSALAFLLLLMSVEKFFENSSAKHWAISPWVLRLVSPSFSTIPEDFGCRLWKHFYWSKGYSVEAVTPLQPPCIWEECDYNHEIQCHKWLCCPHLARAAIASRPFVSTDM